MFTNSFLVRFTAFYFMFNDSLMSQLSVFHEDFEEDRRSYYRDVCNSVKFVIHLSFSFGEVSIPQSFSSGEVSHSVKSIIQ